MAIHSLIDGLIQNNVEVNLWALNTLKHFKGETQAQQLKPKNLSLQCFTANTNITPAGALKNLVKPSEAYHVSRFFKANMAKALVHELQENQYDIIQLEGLSMAVYLPLLKAYSKSPIVLRAHNLEYKIWQRHAANESNWLKKRYLNIQVKRLQQFELYTFKKVSGIAFITAVDEAIYKSLKIATPSLALPCGVNHSEYKALKKEQPKFDLSYLASFDWLPNQQGIEWFMQKVWPKLKAEKPDITMALGGRHMPKHFKEYEKVGLRLFNEVPHSSQFISKGKIVVVPLLAGSGMRIKIIENLALGLAMVATPIAAEGIDITDSVNIKLAKSPQEFTQAVLRLLADAKARQEMSQAAQNLIEEKYTNKALGEKLLPFYQQL
jgi:glycosyltransferase involved in cell wall biosynthesis